MARIMIIDDSALSRKLMRAILEPAGHVVSEASDGIAGIELYFLERPDLVTLDLTMKGLQGFDVLEKLKALDPGARVLVASADIQDSTRQMVAAAGAKGFLTKPLGKTAVLSAVAKALAE